MAQITEPRSGLAEALDRLADFESPDFPVVTLYLDTRPDQQGRDHWEPFVRKELRARARTYPDRSAERESLEKDIQKIERFLRDQLPASANGLAVFACSARDLFDAFPLEAAIEENSLAVSSRPRLYPLARLLDEHPRFAVLVADTRSARILVFSRGGLVDSRAIEGRRSRRTDVGGWSQMRFQRHVDGIREHNVRETVAALERVVEKDRVQHVVIAGDEAALPIFREALSKDLAKRVIDILRLDVRTPEKKILEEALEALREWDARSDAEKVQRVVDDYRAGGLGVVGPEGVEAALAAGQVDELLISASLPSPSDAAVGPGTPGARSRERGPDEESHRRTAEIADELVAKARQTSARVTFIQDTTLLAPYGGVAATLRFRLAGTGRVVSSQ